jgi:hypothetical protein
MRFIIASLALLISTGIACAQTNKLNLRTLALAKADFPELWVAASGKAVPLVFSASQPSTAIQADRTTPFRIFKGELDAKGKPTDTDPTPVELPASPSILLLGWMEEEQPSFLAIADPFTTAKADDWLVINQTKKPLSVQIGEGTEVSRVAANSHQAVKRTAPVGTGAATTVSTEEADGSTKTVYATYLPIFNDQRGLIVVVERGDRIRVNYIVDRIAP